MGWWLAVVFILVLVAGLIWAVRRANQDVRDSQRKWEDERRSHAVSPADLRHTIEVMLVGPPGSADKCVATLFSVFDGADVPQRVSAKVMHYADVNVGAAPSLESMSEDVLALYELRCSRDGATSFADSIHVELRQAEGYVGRGKALSELHRERTGPRARFALVIGAGVALERGWDRLLVEMLRRCRRTCRESVVTGPPTPRHSITGILASDHPMFAVADLSKNGWPRTRPLPLRVQKPSRCFETLMWEMDLAFAPLPMLDSVPFEADTDEAVQYAHSARCSARSLRFFLPDSRVAVKIEEEDDNAREHVPKTPAGHRLQLQARNRQRVSDDAVEALRKRSRVARHVVERMAVAGLVTHDREEALAKLGAPELPPAAKQ